MPFKLDSRLESENHRLFTKNEVCFLLNKNAIIPWLILVPNTELKELLDLPNGLKAKVLDYSQIAQKVLKETFSIEKINFAAIGNVVSQLHIHIVGRHSNDACWPDVVWGAKLPVTSYTSVQVTKIKEHLLKQLNNYESTR